MRVGYTRVSTGDQNPELQLDALKQVGCEKIFVEKRSGAQRDRPELTAALEYMRPGDMLVVWKLDRLARSLKQLIETVETLEGASNGLSFPDGSAGYHHFNVLTDIICIHSVPII